MHLNSDSPPCLFPQPGKPLRQLHRLKATPPSEQGFAEKSRRNKGLKIIALKDRSCRYNVSSTIVSGFPGR